MLIDLAGKIKERVTMRDVCDMYGIQVNAGGFAKCLWHDERTPSMKVYHDGCYCFGCHVQKDVIAVVQQIYGLSFREACKRINDDFGLGLRFRDDNTLDEDDLTDEELMEAANAFRKKRDTAEQMKLEHRRLQDAYSDAMNRWMTLDQLKTERAPEDPFDPLDDAYVTACAELPGAAYALDVATEDLRQFEQAMWKGRFA